MSTSAAVTLQDILAMQRVDVRSVERSALRDIRDVPVQTNLPRKDRILDFIRRIGNPYCFNYKGYVVKISHIKTDTTLQELVLNCIREKWTKEVSEKNSNPSGQAPDVMVTSRQNQNSAPDCQSVEPQRP